MQLSISSRLKKLPPYLFREIDEIKKRMLDEGKRVIDLSIGDPDLPTPPYIIEALCRAVKDPRTHRYPSYDGLLNFRESIAKWYKKRFDVELNPKSEVIVLIGSKEGIAHLPLAFLDPGDEALVPNPGYPVYTQSTILAMGQPKPFTLSWDNGFLPDVEELKNIVSAKTKLLFLNYPNNPTSARASIQFFDRVVEFAKSHNLVVAHDAAYSEICSSNPSPSFLKAKGSMDVGVEFHSLSKIFNMTGWRVGFCVGSKDVLNALMRVKSNVDSGTFEAIQMAGIEALERAGEISTELQGVYKKRRDRVEGILKKAGFEIFQSDSTFYLWCKVPLAMGSKDFAKRLIEEGQVIITPGVGFGSAGEGYFRITLTASNQDLEEGSLRIIKVLANQE